jgi:hypothetical protein
MLQTAERSSEIDVCSSLILLEESNMKKLGFALAALSAIVIAAPSIANAETVIVKRGHPHWHHSRADVVVHRGWHPHPHRDRTVIIRHGHGHRW